MKSQPLINSHAKTELAESSLPCYAPAGPPAPPRDGNGEAGWCRASPARGPPHAPPVPTSCGHDAALPFPEPRCPGLFKPHVDHGVLGSEPTFDCSQCLGDGARDGSPSDISCVAAQARGFLVGSVSAVTCQGNVHALVTVTLWDVEVEH